jgi:D-aminopeptidase
MGLDTSCPFHIGHFAKGEKNLITDVPGVKVGQVTLKDGKARTGVTVILPHEGNIFKDKVMAASQVLNGFGKSIGLVQVDELGTIETPIAMTNTLSVGTVSTALVKYMLEQNTDIGVETGTVNCVVTECNDGELNDIRGMHVTENDVRCAIENASDVFDEGDVGGGTGMICQGLKGGIGSSSRIIRLDGEKFTLGCIVMTNFGFMGNLVVDGRKVGKEVQKKIEEIEKDAAKTDGKDKGSIIMLLATDMPLSERQLKRVARRCAIGLGRTGSFMGNGSGDIALAFTTANRIPHYKTASIIETHMIHDDELDQVFDATAEAVEESVVSALWHAHTMVGYSGKKVYSLRDLI